MKILLFGGTSEGRVLAEELAAMEVEVTVSVATDYGRELIEPGAGLTVLTGRLDAEGIAALLNGFDLCVDATHPYAVDATKNIQAACVRTGTPYLRCLREASEGDGWLRVETARDAAALADSLPGNILLTTGAKELPAFADIDPGRLYARVLPTHEGLSACEALSIPKSHMIAMQGPFSQALNQAMMEQFHIRILVTKDGGTAGGFPEKAAAAKALGAALVVIGRPKETGFPPEEILQQVKEMMA